MAPVDSTPDIHLGNFQLLYSLQAYNKIPVSEYISTKTGLTVVIAEVEGPIVGGYFCLATEAFDDDGIPHTLEHLIFLGSEEFPYKGVLDLLANRCLASGTNAWTDIDHTCYTMETAGSDGFLALMPIFLEHILYPNLRDEAFITEVHHITGDGMDAGVVYCEMQGRENSAESRMYLEAARNVYPGRCGYSSETGGVMKNLRESTDNVKVKHFHKEFYRPENLKVIIVGQVEPMDVFNALEGLEQKILSREARGPFQRPWQSPVPPLTDSKEIVINYPADEENNGLFCMAWRGPSAVKNYYTVTATTLLLKYLTEFSVSPLPMVFVEIEDPYASRINYNVVENSETCLCILFEDVPINKLREVGSKLNDTLSDIYAKGNIDMERVHSIINRYKQESLSNVENCAHQTIAGMIIGHMLYGHTKEDLEQRVNPLTDLAKLLAEPQEYWLSLLKQYLIDNKHISIECLPSKEEKSKMAKEEKERIEAQIKLLGEDGLKEKLVDLERAIESNETEPPREMLVSVPVPTLQSIKFHSISRYSSDDRKQQVDLSNTSVFTYLDHLKTSFAYIFAFLDTSPVPVELRVYLPLFLESILELPLKRDGELIPYERVVAQLNDDTVSSLTAIGITKAGPFTCGPYSTTVSISIQAEADKYETGINWMRDLMYNTVFTPERLKVIATKMLNSVAQFKRHGRSMVGYVMKGLRFSEDSIYWKSGVLEQSKFLANVIERLENKDSIDSTEILTNIEKLRSILTEPSNVVFYIATNLDLVKDPAKPLESFLPLEMNYIGKQNRLKVVPDVALLKPEEPLKGCLVGMGCLESSFFLQTTRSIASFSHPDLPVLMLYMQYLTQAEGPMWKQIRGKGYSYGYSMLVKASEGLLYLVLSKSSNVVGAYKEAKELVMKQLRDKEWDDTLLEAARSSIIFEIIEGERAVGSIVNLSLSSYFMGVDYDYNKNVIKAISKATKDDLNRVGEEYVGALFDPDLVKTVVVTDPSKLEEIGQGFKQLGLDLTIYPSLEESFLNNA